jgi:predicted signal transduction protein with EAL and GGDEF domain
LIAAADQALYEAKARGRGRVVAFQALAETDQQDAPV